jgi:hypothetical protein
VDRLDLHLAIVAELDSPGSIDHTYDPPTASFDGYDIWQCPRLPTRQRWQQQHPHPLVAVHWDGRSSAEDKNPPPGDAQRIELEIRRLWPGLQLVTLTGQLSIRQTVDMLANSAIFVGIDSGFSHVAHSVGLPTFLVEYRLPTVTAHNGAAHYLCRGTADAISRLTRWKIFQERLKP